LQAFATWHNNEEDIVAAFRNLAGFLPSARICQTVFRDSDSCLSSGQTKPQKVKRLPTLLNGLGSQKATTGIYPGKIADVLDV
jgi:hypothetical protein